jgi:hypothetical protein
VALSAGTGIAITQLNNTATISSTLAIPDNLADLSDVTLGNVTTGQVLAYNGTAWTAAADNALTLSTSAASDLGTAAIGTSGEAARADHVHNLPTFAEITNGTATVTGNLTLNASTGSVTLNGGTAGSASLTLNCEANTHGVTIQSPPHSAGATYTLTLPTSDGAANQVLQTDGSGLLSWADQSAGGGGITWATEPAASNSTGSAGQIAYGSGFFYLHDGTEWRRAALATFGVSTPTITITTQPQDMTLADGGSGNFTIAATVSDGSAASYQWQNSDDSGATWDTLTGSTGTTYSLSGVSTLDNGTQYRAIVSAAGAADVTSSVATLTIGSVATDDLLAENGDRLMTEGGDSLDHDGTGGGSATLSFTSQPTAQTVDTQVTAVVTFSAAATHSEGQTVSYQWQRDERETGDSWADISGETSATLDFAAYQGDTDARFRCVASAGGLTATSTAASLTVKTYLTNWGYTDPEKCYVEGTFAENYYSNQNRLVLTLPQGSSGTLVNYDQNGAVSIYLPSSIKFTDIRLYYNGTLYSGTGIGYTGNIFYNGSQFVFEELSGSQLSGSAFPSGQYRVEALLEIESAGPAALGPTQPGLRVSTREFTL